MYFKIIAVAALLAAAPAAAGPKDVNAETFYVTAKEVLAKGMTAMLDSRAKPMAAQLAAAGNAVKAQNDAAIKKGKPLYCVPAELKGTRMGPQQAIAKIGQLPQAQRKASTLEQAWRAALIRDYPCR